MWTIVIAGILTFLSVCNTGRPSKVSNISICGDTVLLFKIDTLVTASIVPVVLPCIFYKNKQAQYNSRCKTLLLLENPAVVTYPDGVYELYITDKSPDINNLSSLHKGFVTVLDLYTLTAPGAKKSLEVDISEPIKKLFLLKQSLPPVYISIRFGPIKMPDGSYASNAGDLRLTRIRIIQVNN